MGEYARCREDCIDLPEKERHLPKRGEGCEAPEVTVTLREDQLACGEGGM